MTGSLNDLFENFNQYGGIEHLSSPTLDGLKKQFQQIRGQLHIVSMYHDGSKHVAWVMSDRKIKKVNSKKDEVK